MSFRYKVVRKTNKNTGEVKYKIKQRFMGIWIPYWEDKRKTEYNSGYGWWDSGLITTGGFYWVNYSVEQDAIDKMKLIATEDIVVAKI